MLMIIKKIKTLLKQIAFKISNNDIKMSILEILTKHNQEVSGLELMQKSNNQVEIGTIYCYLKELEEKGLVSCRAESLDPQALSRKFYLITDKGKGLISNI